ncbi:ASCH domain-containing protein [Nitrospirillum amazonense]|uniref:ASCH domain-containing protein n=1 Tax=Nitrospirillum amazonense TaxID=28077 RepID=UPI002DD450A6|nr:ASCH domain-containing protein [Nitrospirillum amazonense]MEC4591655.1 ASCH domain-containing protein [Nitrospirillum amazonense]
MAASYTGPTKAISVRAPWWWAILHGGKDIENRDWPTRYRGPVLLHASKWHGVRDVQEDIETVADILRRTGVRPPAESLADGRKLTHRLLQASRGCIVGKVDIVNCVDASDSPWFFGRNGFVLENPVAFAKPVPCKGALSFFEVPTEVLAQITMPEAA